MKMVSVFGSPYAASRSAALLRWSEAQLALSALSLHAIALRDLPATALPQAQFEDAGLQALLRQVAEADVVLLATPMNKVAYSGLLKVFLNLLPQNGLDGKNMLPPATGGSLAHLLALDDGLRPKLHALGARQLLDSVFATDRQFQKHPTLGYVPDAEYSARVDRLLQPLMQAPPRAAAAHAVQVATAGTC